MQKTFTVLIMRSRAGRKVASVGTSSLREVAETQILLKTMTSDASGTAMMGHMKIELL